MARTWKTGRGTIGQTATEYMLLISVLVIAVVAASYTYIPKFRMGVYQLGEKVQLGLLTGSIGGVGMSADASVGGDWNEQGSDPAPLPDGDL